MCFYLKDAYALSEDFFQNLGTIKPKKLETEVQYTTRDELDYIINKTCYLLNLELMKYLISNSITITKQRKYSTLFNLYFNNADVCIIPKEQDPFFIKWRKLMWYIKINEISNESCCVKIDSDECQTNQLNFLHIKDLRKLKIIEQISNIEIKSHKNIQIVVWMVTI